MKVYRLVHKDYNGEVVFGLPYPYNQFAGEKKINLLFSKNKPWNQCIPYYKNSKFAFVSLDSLLTFLFKNEPTKEELIDIENNFYIDSFDLSTWSSGLSNFLCTYFDDEVNEETLERYGIKDFENIEYNYIWQDPIAENDIKLTKEEYYSNIKTYYN